MECPYSKRVFLVLFGIGYSLLLVYITTSFLPNKVGVPRAIHLTGSLSDYGRTSGISNTLIDYEPEQVTKNIILVHIEGNIQHRIEGLLAELQKQRNVVLKNGFWRSLTPPFVNISFDEHSFLQDVGSIAGSKIIALAWSRGENYSENFFIETYYKGYRNEGDLRTCPSLHCTRNTSDVLPAWPPDTSYLGAQTWYLRKENIVKGKTQKEYLTFIMLISDVVCMEIGTMYTQKYRILPDNKWDEPPQNINSLPLYEEVFVVTQKNSVMFYEQHIRVVAKLHIYLQFLKQNPQIKIHIGKGPTDVIIILMLRLEEKRFIYGDFRAKLIYVPQRIQNGVPNFLPLQSMYQLYQKEINHRWERYTRNRNGIVLINRIRKGVDKGRHLKPHEYIKNRLKDFAKQHRPKYKFTEFGDDPYWSMANTMKLFNTAVLVFAPHGAGLSNIMFCRPGTFIIEAQCDPPKTCDLYRDLSYIHGHRYFGIPGEGGCPDIIDIDIAKFDELLNSVNEILHKYTDLF